MGGGVRGVRGRGRVRPGGVAVDGCAGPLARPPPLRDDGEEERRTTTTATTTSDEDEDDDDGDGIAASAYGWSITPLDPSALCAISDYAIGGAVAGAVFRGSAVRTRLGARGISSAVGGGRPFLSGILPGAVLGLSAGIAIVALDRARILLDERFGVRPDPRRGVVDDD